MFTSCVKHLDFDQVNDFAPSPIVKSTLVYFTLNQIDFFDLVNSVELVTPVDDTSGFTLLSNSFVRNNLLRAELEFEINNQFNRRFTVNITFLDDNDKITHQFTPIVVNANNANFKQVEKIEIATNPLFLSSKKVRVSIALSPSTDGSVLDPNQLQNLVFKSGGTYYLKT